uniref:Metalloendopeptidase n=1 Tax=Daphnia galeata TaxID=27404 RepID=A0A8J2WHS0_9CRUS|nr:unnamed protein product [Daphnia galeata]
MAFQMFKILSVALLSFYWVELIIGTPTGLLRTPTNFEEREDNLENGDPLTEEELTVNLFSNKAENLLETEKSDLLPWDEQDPELEEGDILPSSDKNALVDVNKHWPNAQVPYVISSNFNSTERSVIGYAMSVYHKNTCIRFIPRKLQANFISIRKFSTGCSSSVGMVGRGVQYVNLNESCISRSRPGTVMHELMHALGFGHEQARPDRDDYVTIALVIRRMKSKFVCVPN